MKDMTTADERRAKNAERARKRRADPERRAAENARRKTRRAKQPQTAEQKAAAVSRTQAWIAANPEKHQANQQRQQQRQKEAQEAAAAAEYEQRHEALKYGSTRLDVRAQLMYQARIEKQEKQRAEGIESDELPILNSAEKEQLELDVDLLTGWIMLGCPKPESDALMAQAKRWQKSKARTKAQRKARRKNRPQKRRRR